MNTAGKLATGTFYKDLAPSVYRTSQVLPQERSAFSNDHFPHIPPKILLNN